jgi:shikimate kinase
MGSVFLTGPKHSGKTSVGKALAELCSGDFIDLDDVVLEMTGKTPRQLFSESPETFKRAEVAALAQIITTPALPCRRVVATGGGIIDNADAVAMIKASGAKVVYLNISADTAWQRIANSPGGLPPFLQTENPQETHRALHERRAAAYLQFADIVIEAEGKTPEEIAVEIHAS